MFWCTGNVVQKLVVLGKVTTFWCRNMAQDLWCRFSNMVEKYQHSGARFFGAGLSNMVQKLVVLAKVSTFWCRNMEQVQQYDGKVTIFWCRNMVQEFLGAGFSNMVEEGSEVLHLSALPSHLTTRATSSCTQKFAKLAYLQNLQNVANKKMTSVSQLAETNPQLAI